MHNKVKPEHFDVMSTKRVVIFQANLKLARKEAEAYLSTNDNNI